MTRRDYQPGTGPVRAVVVVLVTTAGFAGLVALALWLTQVVAR